MPGGAGRGFFALFAPWLVSLRSAARGANPLLIIPAYSPAAFPFPPSVLDRLMRIPTVLVWLDYEEPVVRAFFRSDYTTRADRCELSSILGSRDWPRGWYWDLHDVA